MKIDAFKEEIKKACSSIDLSAIKKACQSFTSRVRAVEEAKGNYVWLDRELNSLYTCKFSSKNNFP